MSTDCFQFKQFTIRQDQCAMKVGTDGVLLGAWAPIGHPTTILDIGTGTGLLALMVAQRTAARIDAVEIDAQAAHQAHDNFIHSPWGDRLHLVQQDIRTYTAPHPYDAILCNPPFFADSLTNPDHARRVARHTISLSTEELLQAVADKLSPGGVFCMVCPAEQYRSLQALAYIYGLYVVRKAEVITVRGKSAKRTMLAFSTTRQTPEEEQIVINEGTNRYSERYITLTSPYYLTLNGKSL